MTITKISDTELEIDTKETIYKENLEKEKEDLQNRLTEVEALLKKF